MPVRRARAASCSPGGRARSTAPPATAMSATAATIGHGRIYPPSPRQGAGGEPPDPHREQERGVGAEHEIGLCQRQEPPVPGGPQPPQDPRPSGLSGDERRQRVQGERRAPFALGQCREGAGPAAARAGKVEEAPRRTEVEAGRKRSAAGPEPRPGSQGGQSGGRPERESAAVDHELADYEPWAPRIAWMTARPPKPKTHTRVRMSRIVPISPRIIPALALPSPEAGEVPARIAASSCLPMYQAKGAHSWQQRKPRMPRTREVVARLDLGAV